MPAAYDDGTTWLTSGFRRHSRASVVALFIGYTGVWIALWGAVVGAAVGIFVGLGVGSSPAGGVTLVSVVAGFAVGAAGGFLAVVAIVLLNPVALVASLVSGAILSVLLVVGVAAYERPTIRMRGYRRLSRQEARRIAPLVHDAADAMNLPALPRFAMEDNLTPNAWTHMRTVVITTGLLDTLDDGELRAVLAHEFNHWRMGDAVGLRFIWAASLPAVLIYNLASFLTPIGGGHSHRDEGPHAVASFLSLVAWFLAWPTWVLINWVIAPLTAASQRRYEYEADAAAMHAGFGADLAAALEKIGAFEAGRTGFERAMTATHPPTELRLEALAEPQADDWEYQEDELHGTSWKDIRRLIHLPRRHPVSTGA